MSEGRAEPQPVRWGVIGTGGIADAFVTDLALLPGASVVAVGSRSAAGAQRFGAAHGIGHRHASYQALVDDPDVDAVYVAVPHQAHHDAALLAIAAGKAVLVEKPFTVSAAEATDLVAAASAAGVLLMEAMWTRFLPHMAAVRALLAAGALGEVTTLIADHGQWFAYDPAFRLFAPELAGGALLDLGVYPVSLASMVFGAPDRVAALSSPAQTGVDAQTSVVLSHPGGGHALLSTTLRALTSTRAEIAGTQARLLIDPVWYRPTTLHVVQRDGTTQRHDFPDEGNGLRHQAAEVARCLAEGRTESPLLPLAETVAVMGTLDEVRRQIGLAYAWEATPGVRRG